jgi:hypothetical protein
LPQPSCNETRRASASKTGPKTRTVATIVTMALSSARGGSVTLRNRQGQTAMAAPMRQKANKPNCWAR